MTDLDRAFTDLSTAALLRTIDGAEPRDERLVLANLVYGESAGRMIVFAHHRAPDGRVVERGVTADGDSFTDVYEDPLPGPNAGPLPEFELDLPELLRRLREEIFPGLENDVVEQAHLLSRGDWIDFADDDRPVWWSALRLRSGALASVFVDAADGSVLQQTSAGGVILPLAVGARSSDGNLGLRIALKALLVAVALLFSANKIAALVRALRLLRAILSELFNAAREADRKQLRQRQSELERLIAEAEKALEAGDVRKAKEDCDRAHDMAADLLETYREKKVIDRQLLEKIQAAIELIREALDDLDDG